EKMLYDNAQLVGLYTEAWQLTRLPEYARVVSETIAWLERALGAPGGAFCASLDADSEGTEGKFYLWTRAELDQLLPPERAALVAEHFGISVDGNFEPGLSVPRCVVRAEELAKRHRRPRDEIEQELAEARKVLFAAREERVPPGRDEKILAGWNGLAIGALARAARAFGHP
ncbi:MAG TPA: thioredoxin domain-containing protein, partial [Myxococcales bacterium]|nr:thioredoxin domain-containing protein [Myxococcales bacterium]